MSAPVPNPLVRGFQDHPANCDDIPPYSEYDSHQSGHRKAHIFSLPSAASLESLSDETLRVIIDNIPHRVFWKNRQMVYVGCNKQFAGLKGLDPSQVIGRTDFELSERIQAEIYRADDEAVMRSDMPKLNYEELILHADGGRSWLRTSKIPLHDDGGNVVGVLCTSEDITKQKNAAEALRESELRFRAICEICPLGIFLLDDEFKLIYENDSAAQIVGRKMIELFGPEQDAFIHPEDRDRAMTEWEDFTITATPFQSDRRYVNGAGEYIPVRLICTVIRDRDIKCGYVGLIEEIS